MCRRSPVISSARRAGEAARHPAPDLEGAVTPAAAAKALQPYLVGTYPHPRSQYACLIDANNGKVLYQVGAEVHREPASLTKIMAATVLLRHGKLSDIVTAPPQVKGVPESSLHLRPGERLSFGRSAVRDAAALGQRHAYRRRHVSGGLRAEVRRYDEPAGRARRLHRNAFRHAERLVQSRTTTPPRMTWRGWPATRF